MFSRWSILAGTLLLIIACAERESGDSATIDAVSDDLTMAEIYELRCNECHSSPEIKAPSFGSLRQLNLTNIAFALTNGKMRTQAKGLSQSRIYELAEYIAGEDNSRPPPAWSFCEDKSVNGGTIYAAQWGADLHNTARVGEEISNIHASKVGSLKLDWAFELPDASDARSQPVVMGTTLFVATTAGDLFALDRLSGCIKWQYQAPVPLRTALTLGAVSIEGTDRDWLFFGDAESHTNAVDAESGELIWRTDAAVSEYSMQTGAVVFCAEKLYVPISLYEVILATDPEHECCKAHGALSRLDAVSGEIEWTTHMTGEAVPQRKNRDGIQQWGPSGVPIWSTPTIDVKRGLVYAGTGQNASSPATAYSDSVIALDMTNGEIRWHFQATAGDTYNGTCSQFPQGANCPKWVGPDFDFGASVIITQDSTGKDVLLAGQKSGDVYALDPDDSGAVIWRTRIGSGSALGGIHWGMAVTGNRVYAAANDPPFPGARRRPGIYTLDIDRGEIVWQYRVERGCETSLEAYFQRQQMYPDCSYYYAFSAALSIANDVVFAPALDGKIRAFRAHDGKLLWQYNTAISFDTVTGTRAHGGAMDSAAVVFAGDHIYLQSGYSTFGQLPGNVLLAFRLTGE